MPQIKSIQALSIEQFDDSNNIDSHAAELIALFQEAKNERTRQMLQYDKRIRSQNLKALGKRFGQDAARADNNSYLFRKTPERMPPTNIKIHCEPERARYYMHPINITLRNLNYIVRTLFKNGKDQTALMASS